MRTMVLPDPATLAQRVAQRIAELLTAALEKRERADFVLCGGGTPRPIFALLASPPLARALDWERVEIWWGDERCVPPYDPESNFALAREILLDPLGIPEVRRHRILGELGPERAARDYAARLGEPPPAFDVVLLGLGADGHTASLFPGGSEGADGRAAVPVVADYEGRPAGRVTLTPAGFRRARHVLFVAAGAGKAEAVAGSLGEADPARWPAQRIVPEEGEVEWWVDREAGGRRGASSIEG